jgi:DNA-binding transcriptional ArsR family regulator
MTAKRSARVSVDPFDALGHPTRRAIVEQLRDGPRSVAEITASMSITQPSVSRHLRLLKMAELVADEPAGARRLYSLRDDGVEAVRQYMEGVWGEAAVRFRLAAENARPPRGRRA